MSDYDDILAVASADLGLEITDALEPGASRESLERLQAQQLIHFPDHAHVIGELEQAWRQEWPDPEVRPHGWLFSHDGAPVGMAIFHVNVRRAMNIEHFLGLDQAAREVMPFRWIGILMDHLRSVGERDCEAAGSVLLGQIAEHYPAHVRSWSRFGYRSLEVDYREPKHGRSWPAYGEPTFFPMIADLRPTQAGADQAWSDLAVRGVSGFLLDHYLLPADHPTVARTLDQAAHLPG